MLQCITRWFLKLTLKVWIGKNLRRTAALLLQANKLHIEYERGVGRDDARVAFAPVGKVRGAGQFSTLAYTHLQNMEELRGGFYLPALPSSCDWQICAKKTRKYFLLLCMQFDQ